MQASPKGYLSGSVSLSTHIKGKERKTPVWELRYRLPSGTNSDKVLGKAWVKKGRVPEGFLTRQQAEVAAQTFLDGHAESVPEDRMSFGRAAMEFVAAKGEIRRGSTMHNVRRMSDGLCERAWRGEATWAQRPLNTFTKDDLLAVRQEMRARGCAPHTINQVRGVLRGIFGKTNPIMNVWPWMAVPKKQSKGKIRFYEPDEIALLKEHALSDLDRALYTLGSEAGLRMSELRGLKIINCDFKDRLLHIEDGFTTHGGHAGTKGHAVRAVPMTDNVYAALWPYCHDERPRFEDNGDATLVFEEAPQVPLRYEPIRRRLNKAIKATGLHRITMHELRHTFGTQMIKVTDIYMLQRLMGHEDITTTEIYLHFKPDFDLASKMSGVFERDTPAEVIPITRAA